MDTTFKGSLKGFTLVELLVVIGIVSILGFLIIDSLIQTLRGENKVRILNQVKQNGQVVLDKLTNEIRTAEKVICTGTFNIGINVTDTLVLYKQGEYMWFRFYPVGSLYMNGANKNGLIAWKEVVEADAVCDTNQLTSDLKFLTNIDAKTGISVAPLDNFSTIFELNKSEGYNDTISINFKVTAGAEAGVAYETTVKEGGIPFTTTVQVRGTK